MPKTPIPLIAGEGRAASKFVSSRSLVNCYLESSGGRPALYGGPGFALRLTLSTGPVRGLHAFGDTLIAVGGNRLYTVTEAGVATDRGEIMGTDALTIADNGNQVMIVSEAEEKSYIWDGATLALITDDSFFPASSVAFLDQYFITSIKGTGRFQISDLADGTSWSALDVATAESLPDNLLRVFVDNRDLLLAGAGSMESQYNSGGADFPFARAQMFFQLGLAGRDAIASVDNTVAFLANDGTVRVVRGGTPVVISTPAIAHTISLWADKSQARAFSFSLRNHQFWVLRHPDGCVIWDASAPGEDAWHVRQSYGQDTWRIGYAANIWDKTIFADFATAKLYTLDDDVHAEASEPLVRYVASEPLGPGAYFTLNELELMAEPGAVADGSADPKLWCELSRNGGKTWGARMERRLGARGEYEKRIVWDGGFGQFRPEGGVVRFGMSDPAPFVIKAAAADYTVDA